MNVDRLFSNVSYMYKLPDSLKAEQKEIIQCILAGKINMIAVQ